MGVHPAGGGKHLPLRLDAQPAQALKQLCVEGADCYEAIKAAAKKDKRIRTNKFRYNPNTELWTITIWFAYDPEK